MKWLVLGAAGRFGSDMVKLLDSMGIDVTGYTKKDLDITLPQQDLELAIASFDVIINAASFDDIAAAELDPEMAFRVNAEAPGKLALITGSSQQQLIHLSSENVFDGSEREFKTTAATNPVNNYGKSKELGERAVVAADPDAYVVRTSWIYGSDENSFPLQVARKLLAGQRVEVDSRERGTPVWTFDLAMFSYNLIEHQAPGGIYHGVSRGSTSWYEFGKLIARTIKADEALIIEKPRDLAAEIIRGRARSILMQSKVADFYIEHWERRFSHFKEQLLRQLE